MQKFKSVYFADYPATSAKRRNLKLAFGPDDDDLFAAVNSLSSEDIRCLLRRGSFDELKEAAQSEGASINAFCLARLREAAESSADNSKLTRLPVDSIRDLRLVDPIQATFRGGISEPLHGWYHYLEGYSPDFVTNVLGEFAPAVSRILDPFAGTGTTPLTVARKGRLCFYCELNPLLQFLVETKVSVLAMPERDRLRIASRLRDLANALPSSLADHAPDLRLMQAYSKTFGESDFFPSDTLDVCLKLRSWLDALNCTTPREASIATIAVVAALIPCSNMIRRGDLRFRKGAERNNIVHDLTGEVSNCLKTMAHDIAQLQPLEQAPRLISGDAKRLDRVARLGIDAIITSPPYLNGTNYYRNTKLELWFLRALLTARDLAAFRRQTVTAGINDVTADRNPAPVSEGVKRLVQTLNEKAYDRRIPKMVLNYFADMKQVFKGLLHHATRGSTLLIDIGDSSYAGVHVDTPAILADLLLADGWKVDQEITLRKRLSRNGGSLRQVLLVATAPNRRPRSIPEKAPWKTPWGRFKRKLPHQLGEYASRNWGNPLHSLCSYQGKMKPSLAHHLVKTFTKPGGRLLDPFGGVGTIPFEAALYGVTAWSFDISPAAVPITAAKLRPATKVSCNDLIDELDCFIRRRRSTQAERRDAGAIRFNGPLPDYFHPKTFSEVLLARRFFHENPPASASASLVFACLLHVLHGNRPYALSRRSHPITPFAPTGEAEYKKLTEKLSNKVHRSLVAERAPAFVPGISMFQDATMLWPQDVDELDAVITSPPFFDSTRFYLANWMRLWFAGWTSTDFKERPLAFVDKRQKQDFRVYESVIRQARERLKPSGVCVFHLGKSRKCDMAEEVALVARPWFRNIETFAESVAHCESHGIRDKGTVVEHTYLVLS